MQTPPLDDVEIDTQGIALLIFVHSQHCNRKWIKNQVHLNFKEILSMFFLQFLQTKHLFMLGLSLCSYGFLLSDAHSSHDAQEYWILVHVHWCNYQSLEGIKPRRYIIICMQEELTIIANYVE